MNLANLMKLQLIIVLACAALNGWSQQKSNELPQKIITSNYTIHYTQGVARSNLFIDKKLLLSFFWVKRGTPFKVSDVKSETTVAKDAMSVTVHSSYKWADGMVDETRVYTNETIKLDYVYTPLKARTKTGNMHIYLKLFDLPANLISYTKLGTGQGRGLLSELPKGKKAVCSSINIANIKGRELDFAVGRDSRFFLEMQKNNPSIFVAGTNSWRQPFTNKGEKYHLSMLIDLMPAKGQPDVPATPIKVVD